MKDSFFIIIPFSRSETDRRRAATLVARIAGAFGGSAAIGRRAHRARARAEVRVLVAEARAQRSTLRRAAVRQRRAELADAELVAGVAGCTALRKVGVDAGVRRAVTASTAADQDQYEHANSFNR